jgi:hypothetical protein
MPSTFADHLTPTAILLVSRGWVIAEVERVEGADETQRARWIDDLVRYDPPRTNGLRNNFIFWIGTLGAAMVAEAIGIRPWIGFVAALLVFLRLARVLAVRTLRWRLQQLRDGNAPGGVRSPG